MASRYRSSGGGFIIWEVHYWGGPHSPALLPNERWVIMARTKISSEFVGRRWRKMTHLRAGAVRRAHELPDLPGQLFALAEGVVLLPRPQGGGAAGRGRGVHSIVR